MIENIGMVMGLLPITGVPLPFISYGGSSMITKLYNDRNIIKHQRKKTKNNICTMMFFGDRQKHPSQNTLSQKHIKRRKKDVL